MMALNSIFHYLKKLTSKNPKRILRGPLGYSIIKRANVSSSLNLDILLKVALGVFFGQRPKNKAPRLKRGARNLSYRRLLDGSF